jgi:[ribosomal protein S18]-alanine N-acetyltransferase
LDEVSAKQLESGLSWSAIDADPEAVERLGRAALELATRSAHGPTEESAEGFRSALLRAELSAALLRQGDRTIGLVCWQRMGRVGLTVGPIAIEPGEATPERYLGLLGELARREGPIAFVAGPLLGLEAPAELRTMRGAGFARYGRMEMKCRAARPFPQGSLTPPGIVLRILGPADEARLAALHARAYRGSFDRYLFLEEEDEARDALLLVHGIFSGRWGEFAPNGSWGAFLGDHLVAATLVARRPAGPMVLDVMADPELRGKGLGRAVLSATVNSLAREGREAVYLNVTEGNAPALRLYRRLGFEVTLGPTHDWYNTRRVPVAPYVAEASGTEAERAGSGR